MIRILSYLIITIFTITFSFAQVQTEEILINNGEIQLPGTLSYTEEKSPLIIWVHGSGAVNRDGNLPKYIKQFREAINHNKIAFFSYDKRTANPKNVLFLKEDGVLIKDFVNDVKQVVNHFKDDKRFTEIILVGHSQGSLVAMTALENVDMYISIAGAGETIDKTLIRQISTQNPIYGAITKKYLTELKETREIKEVDPNLRTLFAKQNQPFLISWMNLNPLTEIKKIKIPALIINGDKDIQVQVKDAENLKSAKPNAELAIIKNMNHVLKTIEKDEDNMKSYVSAGYPISEELVKIISTFILKSNN